MTHFFALLLGAVAGVATGMYVNKSGLEAPDLQPKLFGWPAVPTLGLVGILAALFGGAILGPVGAGVLIGSLVGGDGVKRTKEGMDGLLARLARGGAAGPGAPSAPTPPALPTPAAARQNWVSMLLPHAQQFAANA